MPARPEDLQKLKQPFGILIPDSRVTRDTIMAAINSSGLVAAVGDATTDRLVSLGIIPHIAVIDGLERRKSTSRSFDYPSTELSCSNPSGTISHEAIATLRQALQIAHPTRIVVKGEEDLLLLPLVCIVPRDSVVFYGQPLEGMVCVRTTNSKQKEARDLMESIFGITHLARLNNAPSGKNRRRKSDGNLAGSKKSKGGLTR